MTALSRELELAAGSQHDPVRVHAAVAARHVRKAHDRSHTACPKQTSANYVDSDLLRDLRRRGKAFERGREDACVSAAWPVDRGVWRAQAPLAGQDCGRSGVKSIAVRKASSAGAEFKGSRFGRISSGGDWTALSHEPELATRGPEVPAGAHAAVAARHVRNASSRRTGERGGRLDGVGH